MKNVHPIELEKLHGKFTYCIYKSFNYAVFRFLDDGDGDITVTGNLNEIELNTKYDLQGTFINHPRFGFQFQVFNYTKCLPNSLEGIVAYLSSDIFKGIGVKKAKKIAEHFGRDTLVILKKEPERIDEVELSENDKNTIIEIISSEFAYEENFQFLISLGLSIKDINLILNYYKADTKEIIKENPYSAYYDIFGIGFKKADEIADKIAYPKDGIHRLVAIITYIANEVSFRSGNSYLNYEELRYHFSKLYDDNCFEFALENAIKVGKIYQVEDRYYHFSQYLAEKNIASFLKELNQKDYNYIDDDLVLEQVELLQNVYGIKYDNKQIEAIQAFYQNNISIIVGGPGTGKTTVVKALVETLKKLSPLMELHIVAPTGRAAKRINELCGVNSSTIHSLLKWDKESNTFTHNIENPLLLDVLIIDEFSMVDNYLFYNLTQALYRVKKICIIGDHNQLPSVAPGNLLYELLKSEMFKTTYLNTIFRQSKGSGIIRLSNDILTNSINYDNYKDDVVFIDGNYDDIKEKLVTLLKKYIDDGHSIEDLQVLSPMYKGALGIDTLNDLLQETFNPKDSLKSECKLRYRLFREYDKILQLKNQSSDSVYNGDIGMIESIENKDKFSLIGRFDDIYVEYSHDDLINLSLAYCISVHKSQGSEYPIVFFIASNEHRKMLHKNLIYTACSRASSKLFIIGDHRAFEAGILFEIPTRKTSLLAFLKA